MNHPILPVHRKPRVALLATGDELVLPGRQPGPGQIVYSNGYSVAALAREEGADVSDLGIVRDTVADTVAAIQDARMRRVDVLVTMGGASVGDYDLVQQALTDEGMDLSFWKIAMRPGRPLMHGRLGPMHVLGLPGQSGLGLCLRGPVSGAAAAHADRTRRCFAAERTRASGI